jgi:ParB-like chromosome segregation protein Spo0J
MAAISIGLIHPSSHARALDSDSVVSLAASMDTIGLRTPITVKSCSKFHQGQEVAAFEIVTGRHRLEAAKMLGWEEIEAVVMEDDIRSCRLWEISENLHRAELTALERDSLVAEWVELTGEVLTQSASKPQGGRPEGGTRKASRELGLELTDVQRAIKVASLSPEAQDAARESGLDDNRSALLDAAKQPTPEAQVESLRRRAETKLAPVIMDDFAIIQKQKAVLIKAWESARPEARDEFLKEIGER